MYPTSLPVLKEKFAEYSAITIAGNAPKSFTRQAAPRGLEFRRLEPHAQALHSLEELRPRLIVAERNPAVRMEAAAEETGEPDERENRVVGKIADGYGHEPLPFGLPPAARRYARRFTFGGAFHRCIPGSPRLE